MSDSTSAENAPNPLAPARAVPKNPMTKNTSTTPPVTTNADAAARPGENHRARHRRARDIDILAHAGVQHTEHQPVRGQRVVRDAPKERRTEHEQTRAKQLLAS